MSAVMKKGRAVVGLTSVALMLALAGCSSGSATPDPSGPTSSGAPTSSAPEESPSPSVDPKQIALEAEQTFDIGEPDKVVKGKLSTTGPKTYPAELTVVSVDANETSTRLVFALRNTSGKQEVLNPREMNEYFPLMGGVRDVSVTDPVAERVLLPFLAFPKGKDPLRNSFCACSDGPLTLDDNWFVLNVTLPPLDAATTSVTVNVANFDPVSDVPVTRD